MAPQTTLTQMAADLRRQALLAEAADASRAARPGERTTRLRREQRLRRMVGHLTGMFSRIIDEFEPIPGPVSQNVEPLRS